MDTAPAQETPEIVSTTALERSEINRDFLRFALIAVLILLPIRLFISHPFIVHGASMDPTFFSGQYLIVDELSFYTRDPERGEVVIFKYPEKPSKYYIKRVIGLPGETISGQGAMITITNPAHPQGFVLEESYLTHNAPSNFTRTLGTGEYFVMGDNRPASSDSRSWGAVPRANMVGRAFLRLFPFNRMSYLPGTIAEPAP